MVEVMRRVLLCMLEAVEGGFSLPELLEVMKVPRVLVVGRLKSIMRKLINPFVTFVPQGRAFLF